MKHLHRDRVVGYSNLYIVIIAVFALCASVLAGYLLSELANRAFPVSSMSQEIEPAVHTLNRLIF